LYATEPLLSAVTAPLQLTVVEVYPDSQATYVGPEASSPTAVEVVGKVPS